MNTSTKTERLALATTSDPHLAAVLARDPELDAAGLCGSASGATASYAEIAHRIGSPKSVRAVAQACAANTLAVATPCHRVVRNDGGLSGYRWGVERKRALLEREAARERRASSSTASRIVARSRRSREGARLGSDRRQP